MSLRIFFGKMISNIEIKLYRTRCGDVYSCLRLVLLYLYYLKMCLKEVSKKSVGKNISLLYEKNTIFFIESLDGFLMCHNVGISVKVFVMKNLIMTQVQEAFPL